MKKFDGTKISDGVYLFGASWCSPCTALKKKISGNAELRENITYVGDAHEAEMNRNNISTFPTLLRFEKGKPVARLEGVPDAKELREFVAGKRKK